MLFLYEKLLLMLKSLEIKHLQQISSFKNIVLEIIIRSAGART